MVTAFGREDIRSKASEIGVDNYLLKPVSPSMLYDSLMDIFADSQQEDRIFAAPRKKVASRPRCKGYSQFCWSKTTR